MCLLIKKIARVMSGPRLWNSYMLNYWQQPTRRFGLRPKYLDPPGKSIKSIFWSTVLLRFLKMVCLEIGPLGCCPSKLRPVERTLY